MHKVSGYIALMLIVGFSCLLMGAENPVLQPQRLKVDGKPQVLDQKPSEKLTMPATQLEGLKGNKVVLKPDLVPINPGNVANNCTNPPGNAWKLKITIKNQGHIASNPCTTSITFWVTVPNTTKSAPKTFDIPTPAIQPGQSVEIGPADMPITCYRPDCIFKITIDSKNQVDELDEGNNVMDGWCIG